MSAQKVLVASMCVIMIMFLFNSNVVDGRYLPTRGNNDRVDKLKELLKELLESEISKEDYQAEQGPPRWHPESKLFYKREIPSTPTQ